MSSVYRATNEAELRAALAAMPQGRWGPLPDCPDIGEAVRIAYERAVLDCAMMDAGGDERCGHCGDFGHLVSRLVNEAFPVREEGD